MKELFENWRKVLKEDEKRLTITLPQLRISEKWGEPGSHDRSLIEMFTSKIKGSTISEKIDSLQSLVKDCDEKCIEAKDIPEILGSLVFLDSLASVIYDFNDKTGGFLFESLLAALLGGSARQVPTKGGPYQPIEDLIDAEDKPLSLKFLFAGSKYVKGSRNNLEVSIEHYEAPIEYIVALKEREGDDVLSINFYSFTVGEKSVGIEGDFDSSRFGPWGKGIHTSEFENSTYHIGTLDLGSREELKNIANKYVERLGITLTGIYQDLDALSKHASEYFLNAPESKNSAIEAQKDARMLGEKTKDLK